jgi:hypothetical protein
MRKTAIAAISTGLLAGGALVSPAFASDDVQLSVLHGVPDLTVDVYVNGDLTLDDFEPGDLAGPLELPAGTYTVAITAADAADDSNPAIGPVDLPLEAGQNYTAVAHLDSSANPTASLFTNDTSAAAAGSGKATVRHTAANAEGVEVVVDGGSLGSFNNGEEIGPAELPAGTYTAEVQAGGEAVPPTPTDLPVNEGVNTIVYAWGDASSGAVQVAVQTVDLGHSTPAGVPGGESGAATESAMPLWAFAVAGMGALGLAYLPARKLLLERS